MSLLNFRLIGRQSLSLVSKAFKARYCLLLLSKPTFRMNSNSFDPSLIVRMMIIQYWLANLNQIRAAQALSPINLINYQPDCDVIH